ncbi:MAG: ccc1 [Verrucomicrobiales bacterium]|nr:ccc1 [Verrucomicrobiales bacterium]
MIEVPGIGSDDANPISMQHVEHHFSGGDIVRDVVIGMADGLTVPFALAAGISGALTSSHIVVTAGFAEIAAGSIAMGLGGYLAEKSNAEHFYSEQKREEDEIIHHVDAERQEIIDVFENYGVTAEECRPILAALERDPVQWRDFMMRFELGLETPNPKRALQSAITIAMSYVVGGFIPLAPYILMADSRKALLVSAIVTLLALALFGFVKGHFTGVSKLKSSLQTTMVGGLAAAVAYWIAKSIS